LVNRTLTKIKSTIQKNPDLPEKDKTQIMNLLETLKVEINELSRSHAEEAESIVGFIERSTHETTRKKKNPTLLKLSIDGISESVKEFEASHPKLAETVNFLSSALANSGF
jgi:hypothetical protein